ncbi:hypothetical protein SEA_ATRAXI_36 [Microbacterium phage Atraxi]|nr:hypothetical protein SEA_ATRAXI_36 [Microbacterium phage Atraxi]
MKPCKGCGELTVDIELPPNYDILNPDFDVETNDMSDFGPYDEACFAQTITGQKVAEGKEGKNNA